ncbi:MAG: 3-hydroxyacyl-CoA dehydrogenase [Bacteroidetes bacterium]|nr:3-hydroxyacyl-CoA dehydrogenase [Bacteroidota bacterium]
MEFRSLKNILVVGTGRMASGIATNLLKAGMQVQRISENTALDREYIANNVADWEQYRNVTICTDKLRYLSTVEEAGVADIAVCITGEDLPVKRKLIRQLEQALSPETIIAVNTESILLEALQENTKYPQRIIGLNWCDPAHTTLFLEIIGNHLTSAGVIKSVGTAAVNNWEKDPCIVLCGYSINARLMAALAREALYLVEQGYASVEDIDRACRNDAGYYLPFAGNCRYMDLMGTYAYGLVMKDLNRELSEATQPPALFTRLIQSGETGMENSGGFYNYAAGAAAQWGEQFRKFSFEIKDIIEKYPFNYLKEGSKMVNSKITLNE